MGTPGFAIPSLRFLLDAGYPIAAVVTAPDKRGGRGMKQLISSPIKQFAEANRLPLLQPANLKSKAFLETLSSLQPDLFVVVAFRMLPESVWRLPTKGTINLHGSLLPAYRGAAPIQWAIIRGETMTGVTTFFLRHQIDTGDILLQRSIPILPQDDAATLHDRMMQVGASLVVSSTDLICSGQYTTVPQDLSRVSHAPKLHHDDGRISWDEPVGNIVNLVRGLSPSPGAWTILDGHEFKILRAIAATGDAHHKPGFILLQENRMLVQAGKGMIELLEVQLQGKRRMEVSDFLNGYKIKDPSLT